MSSFKRIGMLLLTLAVSLLPAGCAKPGASADKTLVTSFYPIYIFTANIIKDVPGVELVNMAAPETGCLHEYQLLASDMKALERADVFIINGAGMEGFLGRVAEGAPNLKMIDSGEGIAPLVDETQQPNPHIWLSVNNAVAQVKNIQRGLSELDPQNAAQYEKNADEYAERLTALGEKLHTQLKPLGGKAIVTFHEAFEYFAAEYGLGIAAVVEREPGEAPSGAELAQIVKTINTLGITAVFAEPQYPAKAAETIASETGSKVYTLDPVVTGKYALDAYETAMEQNAQTLLEALGGAGD